MNHAGTHWLRLMLAKALVEFYKLPDEIKDIKAFDLIPPLHRKSHRFKYNDRSDMIRIQQSHAKYSWLHFRSARVILLIRDLRDTVVSHYRSYNARNETVLSFSDFLRGRGVNEEREHTLRRRIAFLNRWAEKAHKLKSCQIVRYEDLRADTAQEIHRLADFIGWKLSDDLVARVVDFARIENMQMMEGNRPVAGNKGKAKKVREGQIGSYHNYFSDDDRAYFMQKVSQWLRHAYGYDYSVW
jgi:hypothetical protein